MSNYDPVKANAWLIESSNDPKLRGSRVEEPKPREMVSLVTSTAEYDRREKLARAMAAQGFIPHHQTGENRPVTSIGEARIILDYVMHCMQVGTPPQEAQLMTEAQEAELTRWLQTGRVR